MGFSETGRNCRCRCLNNTYFSSAYSAQDQDPTIQKFIKDYKAKYNAEPDSFAIHAYDCVLVAAEAIKRAGTTDGTKIAEEIAKMKDFPHCYRQIHRR